MSYLKLGSIIGTGGLGVLAAGLIASHMLGLDLEAIFGSALIIFVIAGAVALIARSIK